MTSPQQGTFRDGQNIFIAVSRVNLNAGNYQGAITLVSNAGAPLTVQIKITVLFLPVSNKTVTSVMMVTPPVLSFMATDGGTNPASQILTIYNPGSQPLTWFLNVSAVQDSFNQNFPSQNDVTWLRANQPLIYNCFLTAKTSGSRYYAGHSRELSTIDFVDCDRE